MKRFIPLSGHIFLLWVRHVTTARRGGKSALAPKEITRIREIMHTIRVEDVFEKLKDWTTHNSHDLLEAWLLISRFHSQENDDEYIKTSVNKIYRDIWVEMNNELTALEKIRVINHVFYNVHKFDALQEKKPVLAPYLPGNLLRTQKGNTLSMALLYLVIVQRLNIPIFGVNLPEHLILAFTNGKTMLKPATDYLEEEVLFYLNPFNKGAVFRKGEIELFIRQLKIKEQESFYLPCENKVVSGVCCRKWSYCTRKITPLLWPMPCTT